jgi:hypothetical protein
MVILMCVRGQSESEEKDEENHQKLKGSSLMTHHPLSSSLRPLLNSPMPPPSSGNNRADVWSF